MNPVYILPLLLTIHAQMLNINYFQNLPINSTLMAQANSAINDLHAFLDINFECPSDDYYPGVAKTSTASQTYPSLSLQNLLSGNFQSSFQTNQPIFGSCLTKPAYGSPSLTLQYFHPKPANYIDMNLIPYAQKLTLYNQLRNIIALLSQIKAAIKKYAINNVVVGKNNTVAGSGNVVIGSNDKLKGTSNWILTSNYVSSDVQDGVLVVGNYMIQLNQYFQVLKNPSLVLNCVNTQQAAKLVNVFWGSTSPARRYCFMA